jgi:hypothetical protein
MFEIAAAVWVAGILLFWGLVITSQPPIHRSSLRPPLFVLFWPFCAVTATILLILALISDAVEDFKSN